MKINIIKKPVEVKVIKEVTGFEFVLSEKEALLIRDILGGINHETMERILNSSRNFSKFDENQAYTEMRKIGNGLDNHFLAQTRNFSIK